MNESQIDHAAEQDHILLQQQQRQVQSAMNAIHDSENHPDNQIASGTIVLDNHSRMVDREHHQTAQNLYENNLDGTNAGMTSDGRIS